MFITKLIALSRLIMSFLCHFCRLLVGAPLAHTDQPLVDRGGAVYRCSVDSSEACQQIAFDRSGKTSETPNILHIIIKHL